MKLFCLGLYGEIYLRQRLSETLYILYSDEYAYAGHFYFCFEIRDLNPSNKQNVWACKFYVHPTYLDEIQFTSSSRCQWNYCQLKGIEFGELNHATDTVWTFIIALGQNFSLEGEPEHLFSRKIILSQILLWHENGMSQNHSSFWKLMGNSCFRENISSENYSTSSWNAFTLFDLFPKEEKKHSLLAVQGWICVHNKLTFPT